MKSLAATGGVFATAKLLPESWTRPMVESVALPAHAQSSPPVEELVTGPFTTGGLISSVDDSILDLVVPTAHASVVTGSVILGNASFDVSWDVDANGYTICGAGQVFFPNATSQLFTIGGGGGRSGNSLDAHSQSIPLGTLEIFGQMVQTNQLTFDCMYDSESLNGVIAPSGGGCTLQRSEAPRFSSPYPDEDKDLA